MWYHTGGNTGIMSQSQGGAFNCTVITLEGSGSGAVKVVAYQAVNPGLNGNFAVAEITFEALGVGEGAIDLGIVTLTDSSPPVNYLDYAISNGTVTICQTG